MTQLSLLQIGDLHGHLLPRPALTQPHLTGVSTGGEGGLARLATLIRRLRDASPNSVLVNTGDTIQGGAEALFSRGQAMVDVLDRFDIDLFAPGNWDYLYGKDRFLQLFGEGTGPAGSGRRWGALAANVYHAGSERTLLPPSTVLAVGDLRLGVIGLSSERAIAIGAWFTAGITFTADAAEVPDLVRTLREQQRVDLVLLISEFGLAKNVLIAERNPGIDVVLSSDMHEETAECVVTRHGTLISEVGQDGTRLGQLELTVTDRRVVDWSYTLHSVDSRIQPDAEIERLVAAVRAPFRTRPVPPQIRNPLNGATLAGPIDAVVGRTAVPLHRSDFCRDQRPAVLGGSSHDLLTTAFRQLSAADIGHLRGFRYGTHVAPGVITREDLYHLLPIGAQIARITITGHQLHQSIEKSADGTFNPDPFRWTGGWLNSYAGVRFALDVYREAGQRVSRIQVQRFGQQSWEDLDPAASYSFAGFWYASAPRTVGGIEAAAAAVPLRGPGGAVLDATELVVEFLRDHEARAEEPRVDLLRPLPLPVTANSERQPLRGAEPAHRRQG